MRFSGTLLLFFFLPNAAWAESVIFECGFSTQSVLEDGKVEVSEVDFELRFLIDGETNKAFTIGNNGSEEVILINGESGITFIEVTETGNVMTTTVDRENNSVHSRHTVIFGGLLPQQFYGTCYAK